MVNEKDINKRIGRPIPPRIVQLLAVCAARFDESGLTFADVADETGLDRSAVSRALRLIGATRRTYTRLISYYDIANDADGVMGFDALMNECMYHADRLAEVWRRIGEYRFNERG